jgi:hypothetical protein
LSNGLSQHISISKGSRKPDLRIFGGFPECNEWTALMSRLAVTV